MIVDGLISKAKEGFKTLEVREEFKEVALDNLRKWLTEVEFSDYRPQIEHIINSGDWDYLLDSFYKVIPFGTGGRRGEVGVGPNRINPWTVQTSAQGHSQYLIKKFQDEAKTQGLVIAYDVRQFFTNVHFNDELPNPVKNISSKDLAFAAAQVYAANGLKVYTFEGTRTTPELSFAVRHLGTCAGVVISASHNPPEHNGKKVYDEFGGQPIPPDDEILVREVTENVREIKEVSLDEAKERKLFTFIGKEVDNAYLEETTKLSLSAARNVKIVYTPLHGSGSTSVMRTLERLNFSLHEDPKTSNESGKFENITFNIPNPEIIQSFDTALEYAQQLNADIILNSDPDADRIGVMVKHNGGWHFLDGNIIGTILVNYVIEKRKGKLAGRGVVIKTDVTTNAITKICEVNNIDIIGNLLVGFKYIAAEMNKLQEDNKIDLFLLGAEESNGYIAGNYVRDKDAAVAAVWLSELAGELKEKGQTLLDYLDAIYARYGYFQNYLTEIRLPGAEGFAQIRKIQDTLRKNRPAIFGQFKVAGFEDWLERKPIVSETDQASKDALVFHFQPPEGAASLRVSVRPSGTEPKIKMYFEIGTLPFDSQRIQVLKDEIEKLVRVLEKDFMTACYKIIGVDFPERAFLLFWQLPLKTKLKYFEIEEDIARLQEETDLRKRQQHLDELLAFLGSDPIEKIDKAFQERYHQPLRAFLGLDKE